MASAVQQRAAGKAKAQDHGDDDPLAVLDERGAAEPLDDHEQDRVIFSINEANETSNYVFRGLMLVMLVLVEVLYLSPIPDYIRGTHPESHLTLFFGAQHMTGTHDDLVKFPSLPIYLAFFAMQSTLLMAAAYETADRMGLVRSKGVSFPHQPHVYGTAPDFVAPLLSDIRWHPTHMGVRADAPDYRAPAVMATMPPRLLYLCALTFVSFPLPLMTFGTGSFVNAGWWAITTAVLVVLCLCERTIDKFEKEARGLTGMKYGYKGA